MPLLSIIVPVYNEVNTVRQILEKINSVPIDKEIIIVDDGSTDGTDKALHTIHYDNLKIIHHTSNRGKGAAFQTGLANLTGDYVVIQDADLEYEPGDYPRLLEPLTRNEADLVLGVRFIGGYHGLLWHRLGNRFLTFLLNLCFGSRLNDYATCYKAASRETFRGLGLKANRFDLDAEIVCNALKKGKRIMQVPVAYHPRNYRDGKKIRWKDGIEAIVSIIKYRFSK